MQPKQMGEGVVMGAAIIDGKAAAAHLRESVKQRVVGLKAKHKISPKLVVVLVGDDAASAVYVRNKHKACEEVGIGSEIIALPAITSEEALLAEVQRLNADASIHGILVQLPLPAHIHADKVIQTIHPDKDVDGFHVQNAGRLMVGLPGMVPCTPKGCLKLIHQALGEDISGKHAVVIGRSNIVGKPVAQLLLQQGCTVTICHSKTRDIEAITRQGDIVVAAVGRPLLVKDSWVKPGACVVDVGINRVDTADGKSKLVGDVDFTAVQHVARSITPVPGGVGPMTIACLLENTLDAFEMQHGA